MARTFANRQTVRWVGWACVVTLACGLAACTPTGSAQADELLSAAGITRQLDRLSGKIERIEHQSRPIKQVVREVVGAALPLPEDDDRFGVTWSSSPAESSDGRPVVLLLHGYNSGPESLANMLSCLRDRGYPCGYFSYPNDGPIPEAAAALELELRRIASRFADHPIVLVTHSMGGLVARTVLEAPHSDVPNVERLIMIAPPTNGSMLARIPLSSDLIEHVVRRGTLDPINLVRDTAADGMNEARSQLRPGSPFLKKLNARDRNARLQYSVILGSGAPLDRDRLKRIGKRLVTLQDRWGASTHRTSQLLELLTVPPDEIIRGHGDGVVAIERGRLEGVDDTIVLPMTHWTLLEVGTTARSQPLLDAVLARIEPESG